jgi:DNA modification methylase
VERLVQVATRPEELILDPFAGAGTLALAARRQGRRWLLIESEGKYVETAWRRLAAAEKA